MKITGNNNLTAMTQVGLNRPVATEKKTQTAQFDQINLSAQQKMGESDRTQQEVASKISHEVRTHNTTSKIAELREQVQSGTYTMDARETASRMLLMGAVE